MSELSRPARWVLLISLLLNAALIGGFVGNRIAARKAEAVLATAPAGAEASPPASIARLARMIPPEQRPMLRDTFEEYRPQFRQQARDLHLARRRVADLLRADALDRAALESALADLRQAEGGATRIAHAMMVDLLERLAPAQRQRLAERLEQQPQRERPGLQR